MSFRTFTLWILFLAFASASSAVVVRERSKLEATRHLRKIALAMFEFTAKHEEKFPEKIEELKGFLEEDKDLFLFLEDPKLEYYASGEFTHTIKSDSIMCTYDIPGKGRLTLFCFGNIEWEESKKSISSRSIQLRPALRADLRV